MKKNVVLFSLLIMIIIQRPAHAGDKEWAIAGKVLTGIVTANIIGDIVTKNHQRRAHVSEVHYHHPVKRHYHRRHQRRWQRRARCTSVRDTTPVIVYINEERRIYQERIKGATAYLQHYSSVCKDWITMEEYPSIW